MLLYSLLHLTEVRAVSKDYETLGELSVPLDAIKAARESTASILEALSETEWERAGVHNEMGDYSIDTWLEVYAAHCHDHADQARRAAVDGG